MPNCIYCQHPLCILTELEHWYYCLHCLKEHKVDVLYTYSEWFQCFSNVQLCYNNKKRLYRIAVSPILQQAQLGSARWPKGMWVEAPQYITKNILRFPVLDRKHWRWVVHPHASWTEVQVLTLPLFSLHVTPANLKSKIESYLLFL